MTAPFNVGHDATIDIVDGATGAVITSFPPTTMFDFSPNTVQLTSKPVNDKPLYREVPDGWKGTIEYDRYDSSIDDYFVKLESDYWAGVSYFANTITQTVTERDGSISQYKFTGVALKLDNAGSWKAADKVGQRLSWVSRDRIKVI